MAGTGLQGRPPPQGTACSWSCCHALLGWKGWCVTEPPPATSAFLFCAQQCLILPTHAVGMTEGARLASASCACRQGGCTAIPLCFKALCQHSKSKPQSLKKLGDEVIPSRCCADSAFFAVKTMVSWEAESLAPVSFIAGVSTTLSQAQAECAGLD